MIILLLITAFNLVCAFICISFYLFTCKVRNNIFDYINREINVCQEVYNKTLSFFNDKHEKVS